MRSKRELEIQLSKLKSFSEVSISSEQYATPAHIAADWVWQMAMQSEVAGKIFLDAACGPGILGLGLLLLGARKIYFLDNDAKAINICVENYNKLKEEYEIGDAEFITADITLFDEEVDCVIENPPFGTKEKHIDKVFLEKAFSIAPLIYSMHKYVTKNFIEAIVKDYNFEITSYFRYDFPIKAQFSFHKKPVKNIDVAVWRMVKR